MPIIPHQTETEIARTELRDAVRAYSLAPTVRNEKRAIAAMRRWREINMLRHLPTAPAELSSDPPITQVLRSRS